MINILVILSGILIIGPTLSLLIDLFDKVYAGNYFFRYALTLNLQFALAGPNALTPLLGDCFLWGMAGFFVCLSTITLQSHSGEITRTFQPVLLTSPKSRYPRKQTTTRRKFKKTVDRNSLGWVYLLRSSDDVYKIGRTRDPKNRIRTFSVKLPFDVEYEHLVRCDDMYAMETELHQRFADKRLDGEWFILTDNDVEYIKSL